MKIFSQHCSKALKVLFAKLIVSLGGILLHYCFVTCKIIFGIADAVILLLLQKVVSTFLFAKVFDDFLKLLSSISQQFG